MHAKNHQLSPFSLCRHLAIRPIIAAILITSALPAMAVTDADYQQINALYESGNLEPALVKVNFLLNSDANNGTLHYCKGNLLVRAARVAEARAEYQKAIACKPSPTIVRYCLEALRIIGTPATNSAVEAIRNQTLTTEQNLQQQAYKNANSMRQSAILQANQINVQTQAATNNMRNAGYYDRHNREWIPLYSPQDISRVQAEGDSRAQDALLDGQRNSQAVVAEAQRRAQAMEDSAQSLESQLVNRSAGDKVHLDTAGTNLYVRHYLSDTTPQTPLKAKQAAGQFSDPLSAGGQSLTLPNQPFGSQARQKKATTNVEGKLLK